MTQEQKDRTENRSIQNILEEWFADAGFTISDSESIAKLITNGDVPHVIVHCGANL